MRKIDELLAEYGESHQNATNKAIHWICVPLIFLSVVGLIASIPSNFVQSLNSILDRNHSIPLISLVCELN